MSSPSPTLSTRWNDLQTLYELGSIGGRGDGRLLEHFANHDGPSADAAFRTLVERHGPMVLRVCRAILDDEHDAQDAFQATFLILIRKSKSVRNQASIGSWLHGVARRVASKARVEASKRHALEQRAAGLKVVGDSPAGLAQFAPLHDEEHILRALDEEIGKLPEKYRAPVVLCYLEGLTQERAAEHLGWPSGTVRGRLARARDLLKSRLSRRGLVTPASVLLTSGFLGAKSATAAAPTSVVPKTLILSTVQTSSKALGGTAKGGTAIAALATGVARSMMLAKVKAASIALLGVIMVVGSAGMGMGGLGPFAMKVEGVFPKTPNLPKISDTPAPSSTNPVAASPIDTTPLRSPSAPTFSIPTPTIDGDLADWPVERLNWHDIATPFPRESVVNGFRAKFATAYNEEDQRIYVAVVVDDDQLVTNQDSWHGDGVEIFVEAPEWTDLKEGPLPPSHFSFGNVTKLPMLQYAGIASKGKAYGDPYGLNPTLNYGDCRKTRTEMKYRTIGKITTYEWAIEVFDRYPNRPSRLEPGKHVGFDLAVVDQDKRPSINGGVNTDHPWISWGPCPESGFKGFDVDNIGELILMPPDSKGP